MAVVAVFILVGAVLVGLLADTRRFGFWGGFFASLLFTPLGGLFLTLISGPRPESKKPRAR